MDRFFIILIVIMLVFILSIFLFVYFASIGVDKNVDELRAELERAEAPTFSPMGIYVAFMKALLSFFSWFR